MDKIFVVAGKIGTLEFNQAKNEIVSQLRKQRRLTTHLSKAAKILVLGGDGTMLKAIRQYGVNEIPFCGLNFGHIGFLMNEYIFNTIKQITDNKLNYISVPLLEAKLFDRHDKRIGLTYAFNDIYLERSSTNTAKISISVGKEVYFDPLISDGVIVASAAGSTGYTASAGGVIVPIETNSLIVTGICPALFHRWKSSQLAPDSRVILAAKELDKRPVRMVADGDEIPNAVKAEIYYSDKKVCLAFLASQDFRRKVLDLQFHNRV
ncbi:MAG: NAD(+)/NADH kinase [Candidatus Parcubacteria bacterium]|nr:NAD(+)/NADH kinase [Candidatus Parcubacteria bacterium]